MELPNLNKIIDTYILIKKEQPLSLNEGLKKYINQLRTDLIPHIRQLQNDKLISWFCFLIHGASQLNGREKGSKESFIHIKLEPNKHVSIDELIPLLPPHFKNPIQLTLSDIDPLKIEFIKDKNWANAWKMHGDTSELVLSLIENHDELPIHHIIQFLHFITNPLYVGQKSLFVPGEIYQF